MHNLHVAYIQLKYTRYCSMFVTCIQQHASETPYQWRLLAGQRWPTISGNFNPLAIPSHQQQKKSVSDWTKLSGSAPGFTFTVFINTNGQVNNHGSLICLNQLTCQFDPSEACCSISLNKRIYISQKSSALDFQIIVRREFF